MEISVSRKTHFNAAHRLNVAHWSEEKTKHFLVLVIMQTIMDITTI